MEFEKLFKGLDRVAAHLPFALHNTREVNAAFEAWQADGDAEMKRIVDLWTYCFVRRYVLVTFAVDRAPSGADLELLVERIYRKIAAKQASILDARRYAGWVSVVCKNAYFNYCRTAGRTVLLDPSESPAMVSEPGDLGMDTITLLDALYAEIDSLPSYLREVGRLRFVNEQSYEDISRSTGLDLAIVRSYVCKVAKRLRKSRALTSILKPGEKKEAA